MSSILTTLQTSEYHNDMLIRSNFISCKYYKRKNSHFQTNEHKENAKTREAVYNHYLSMTVRQGV